MTDVVTLPPPLNDGFDQPMVVDDVLYAFPGHLDRLLPEWEAIPDEFKQPHNEWVHFVNVWFGFGWPEKSELYTRDDVDPDMAFRHLATIMRSFEPKHEHKISGVAWLMSRWFAAIRPKA